MGLKHSVCAAIILLRGVTAGQGNDTAASVVWELSSLSSVGGYQTTVVGQPVIREFGFGRAVEFDGVDDGLIVQGCPLNGSESWTIEILFMPYASFPNNVEQRFLHIQRPGFEARRMLIELRLTGNSGWFVDTHIRADSSALTSLAKEFPHPVGRWYHVAFVYDRGVARHFVNGAEEMSGRVPFIPVEDAEVSLGMRMNRRSFFKGAIRSVSMSRRALHPGTFVLASDAALTAELASDAQTLFSDDFRDGLRDWIPEREKPSGSSVGVRGGKLDVDVSAGATVWYRRKLSGNLEITYDVTVVDSGGRNDRVSDLNVFWMASDPSRGEPFGRDGKFSSYDDLDLYYAGVGGHDNTTTRFRRYHARGNKPVVQEYTDRAHLLEGNRTYAIRIVLQDGRTSFFVNGERYFEYVDEKPLTDGYFGFRTTRSHQRFDNFRVRRLAGGSSRQGERHGTCGNPQAR